MSDGSKYSNLREIFLTRFLLLNQPKTDCIYPFPIDMMKPNGIPVGSKSMEKI